MREYGNGGMADVVIPYHRLRLPVPPVSLLTRTTTAGGGGSCSGGLPLLAFGLRSTYPKVTSSSCCSLKIRALGETEYSVSDLEDEVYDFMMTSENPSAFPTKDELVAAGRGDLALAIAERGGWLALGWDLDDNDDKDDDDAVGSRVYSSSDASSSGREQVNWEEKEDEDGIQGILSRLDKERNFSYSVKGGEEMAFRGGFSDNIWNLRTSDIIPNGNREAGEEGVLSETHSEYKLSPEVLSDNINGRIDLSSTSYATSQSKIHLRLRQLESQLKSTLNLLRSKDVVMPTEVLLQNVVMPAKDPAKDAVVPTGMPAKDAVVPTGVPAKDAVEPTKFQGSSRELLDLSDAWEFQQTEIIKAQDKLRSTRAKLMVLEGKMALDKVEAERTLEDKQKRIRTVQKASNMLRTVCVVWPNAASEVLLTGSFDGWTSQRRMDRLSTGIFSLNLKLYPGQYEIKFIVDGIWRVDPLRPLVNNDGYENNLLVIV